MARRALILSLILAAGATARADVVVLKREAEQALVERDPAVRPFLEKVQGSEAADPERKGRPQYALRGQVSEVQYGNPNPNPGLWVAYGRHEETGEVGWHARQITPKARPRVRLVVPRVQGDRLDWDRGVTVWLELGSEVDSIDHEVDSPQDLRWVLGNRHVQFAAGAGTSPAGLAIGASGTRNRSAWLGYFLRACNLPFPRVAGGPGEQRARLASTLGRWTDARAAYAALSRDASLHPADRAEYALYADLCTLPELDDPRLPTLQEGWLVHVLRDGPLPGATGQAMQLELRRRLEAAAAAGDPYPVEGRVPWRGFTAARDALGCDVETLARDLLRIAAADDVHGGAVLGHRTGSSGTFYLICQNVLELLCGFADLDPYTTAGNARGARGRALSLRAREAVIGALEAAVAGREDPDRASGPSDKAAIIAEIMSDPTLSREAKAAMVRKLRSGPPPRRSARPQRPQGLRELRALEVDPSVVAYAAVQAIKGSRSWRWAEWDRVRLSNGATLVGYLIGATRDEERQRARDAGVEVPHALVFHSRELDPRNGDERFVRVELPWARSVDFRNSPPPADPPSVVEVVPGSSGRLVRALVALGKRPQRGGPRARDVFRASLRGAPRDLLGEAAVDALAWLLQDAAGTASGAASARAYRRHTAQLMAELSGDERLFARDALARVGFGDLADLERAVDRLFDQALTLEDPQTVPETVVPASYRASLQMAEQLVARQAADQRLEAVSVLAYLAELGVPGRAPTESERAVSAMVLRRIDELLAASSSGSGGRADAKFFEAVEDTVTAEKSQPFGLLQSGYRRASAEVLLGRYQRHVAQQVRNAARELAELDRLEGSPNRPLDFETRRERLQAERERADRLRERLEQFTGKNQ